jgi:nickel transport protein
MTLIYQARTCVTCIALALMLLHASPAAAHGAVYEAVEADTVALRFAYLLGDPMQAAQVRVFAPGQPSPFQSGQTDARGRFAFIPDRPGTWAAEADDGRGHYVRAQVEVSGSQMQLATPDAVAVSQRVLLGALVVSLLIIAGLISLLLARRR